MVMTSDGTVWNPTEACRSFYPCVELDRTRQKQIECRRRKGRNGDALWSRWVTVMTRRGWTSIARCFSHLLPCRTWCSGRAHVYLCSDLLCPNLFRPSRLFVSARPFPASCEAFGLTCVYGFP